MDLFEAFVNLERLNEQDFDTDKEGIKELADFFADDDTEDAIEIIDPISQKMVIQQRVMWVRL